jgi:RHS repeat-associated protein
MTPPAVCAAGALCGNRYRYTGKERDTESGNDYFEARYYSSAMGRFLSADSSSYSGLTNPQSWNLYAYSLNNPLRYIDPSGHTAECATNATDCLAAAQAAVGKTAAAQLTTQTTTTQNWFQKLFGLSTTTTTLQITGNEADFRAASGNASKLADLIDSKTNIQIYIQQDARMEHPGALGWMSDSGWNMMGGAQTMLPSQGLLPQVYLDPRLAMVPGNRQDEDRDHIPPANIGEKFAHELLGHMWGELFGGHTGGSVANKRDSVNSENEVRRTEPSRGQKTKHHDE